MRKDPEVTTHSADGAALVYYRCSGDGSTAFFLFFFLKVFPCCGFLFQPPFFILLLRANCLAQQKKSVFLVSRVQPR